MGQRWKFQRNNEHQLNEFNEYVKLEWLAGREVTVEFVKPHRSTAQNAMFYGLYRDIANQRPDQSILDIRKECKLHYGIKILKGSDPEFCEWYDQNIKPWPYEAKLVLMEHMDVTSEFDKEQASEYISTILTEYQKQGCYLPDPREEAVP